MRAGEIHDHLAAQGYPVAAVRCTNGMPEVTLAASATDQQRQEVAAWVAAYDPAPTEGERLDAAEFRRRVENAKTIRLGSQWAALPAAKRNRVQAVIDAAAAELINLLS